MIYVGIGLLILILTMIVASIAKRQEIKRPGTCSICAQTTGKDNPKYKLRDGYLCHECVVHYGQHTEGMTQFSLSQDTVEHFLNADKKIQEIGRTAYLAELEKAKAEYRELIRATQEAKANQEIRCSKCGSNQLTAGGKKLSVGRAVVGGALLGGVGAVLGGVTSKKVMITCLNCGNRWQAGKQ